MVGACVSDLLASAFSSSLSSSVVTYDQYKSNPDDAYYQALDINQLFSISHLTGKIGERPTRAQGTAANVDSMELFIKTLTGKTISVNICKHDIVEQLIEDAEGIPVHVQRVVFAGKQLQDDKKLSEYAIENQSTLHLVQRMSGGACPTYYIDDSLLDPAFDYDFTGKKDDGTVFYRGDKRYYRPYGWKRCALKVLDRYRDNKWLGRSGHRTGSSDGEWPVSYHGTGVNVSGSIAQEGYDLSKGKRFRYGRGIYSTPSIDVAAMYAHRFEHKGERYQLVFQNRVRATDLKVIDSGVGEYWVQPHEDFIRPYGICIRRV
jgi:hypothetical protein